MSNPSLKTIDEEVAEFLSQPAMQDIIEFLDKDRCNALSHVLREKFAVFRGIDCSSRQPQATEAIVVALLRSIDSVIEIMSESKLKDVLLQLRKELETLFSLYERRIIELESDVRRLKEQIETNELLLMAADIGTLYTRYIFEPQCNQTWTSYANQIGQIETTIEEEQAERLRMGKTLLNDNEIDQRLNKFLQPIQQQFSVDLEQLRRLKQARAAVAHTRYKLADEQRDFLAKAQKAHIPIGFEYTMVFQAMLDALDKKKLQFRRIVYPIGT
ncbi:unnamed protein product [Didymodactylos carnosus]|uniref:Uncharacterized protein n=1 Tax=Didymodactylos carnosus TaxID=1234261 RepID=A0A815PA38_9BILA|nr:unnamed protein product [Didymodactylos carnosus]CAF1446083.1 unnamed protein product [Didymodactylos carnosus]CAF3663220.1 unnamed protein product [Didymodactylos carnosus]CAF4320691.1 unnamed protein product [Didymodactylos carnosus]